MPGQYIIRGDELEKRREEWQPVPLYIEAPPPPKPQKKKQEEEPQKCVIIIDYSGDED